MTADSRTDTATDEAADIRTGTSTIPTEQAAQTATSGRTRPRTDIVEYHDDAAQVRSGKSSVWVQHWSGKLILSVDERGTRRCGKERIKVNVTASVALVDGSPAKVARAIESAVRLARSTEMVDGHPLWCNARDCRAADGQHSLGTCELELEREECVSVALYRRKDGSHRVDVYVTTEYSGEANVALTLDEAAAVAQLLRFAGRRS